MAVGEEVLLASPLAVLGKLLAILATPETYRVLLTSGAGILGGFLSGLLLGAVLALAASRFRAVELLLFPYMVTIRSVPVASFIVVAWVWLDAATLPGFISFLIVLPIVYNNLLAGLSARDRALDEMASVYRIPYFRRLLYILRPQLRPTLLSAAETAVGLAWKSGVAAEIICYPENSLGRLIYQARQNLYTSANVFALTLIVVVFSIILEKLLKYLLSKGRRVPVK